MSGLQIKSCQIEGGTLTVQLGNKTVLNFEDCWLRDQCRCSECYHVETFQKAVHILDIPDVGLKSVDIGDTELTITWTDNHVSKYDLQFLYDHDYNRWIEERRFKPLLWKGNIESKVKIVPVNKFFNTVDGAKLVFQSLLDYGVALIEGVEPSEKGTEQVCLALGGIQHTLFGGMWSFTTKPEHADTAYTNLPLASHNDSTYFTESTGLQILHCLEHTGSGGETILVDGFYGATELKAEHPEDFEFLVTHDVEAEYIEEGHHHKYSVPIINVNSTTKDLKQIRFNVYDRSSMPLATAEETRSYYRALRNLSRYYQDSNNQWQFKLKPGLVMVMDNFRVLHGRTSFTGKRILCGAYVSRSDWLDRARVLKLIK